MNIQQLLLCCGWLPVVLSREAAEKMALVSQAHLFLCAMERKLALRFSVGRVRERFWTRRYGRRRESARIGQRFHVFQNQYANPEEEKDEFSASQHCDSLAANHYGHFRTLS